MILDELTAFETETGGFMPRGYATAETAEAIATLVRQCITDNDIHKGEIDTGKYKVTVELSGSQYPRTAYDAIPSREIWVCKRSMFKPGDALDLPTYKVIERMNAGLIAWDIINRGEQVAKERVIATLRWAGADL